MDTAIRVINAIGNIGGIIGLAWAGYGVWDFLVGIRRELDEKKDKGITSIVSGAVLGVALKAIFAGVAAALSALGF